MSDEKDKEKVSKIGMLFLLGLGIALWLMKSRKQIRAALNEDESHPPLEDLWKQLSNALSARSDQDQVTWSIFGIFWAANALLFIALFTASNKLLYGRVVLVVSFIGIFTSIIWFLLVHRALGHIAEYERVMWKIENFLFKEYPKFRITLEPNAKTRIRGRPQARVVMRWAIRGFFVIWVIVLAVGIRICFPLGIYCIFS
jgi:hypothetical protein